LEAYLMHSPSPHSNTHHPPTAPPPPHNSHQSMARTNFPISEELRAAWVAAVRAGAETDVRALQIDVDFRKEAISLRRAIGREGEASVEGALRAHVLPLVGEDEPCVFLLRDDEESRAWHVLSYIPDTAPVRAKMLIASSLQDLCAELGEDEFGAHVHTTEREELSAPGIAARLRGPGKSGGSESRASAAAAAAPEALLAAAAAREAAAAGPSARSATAGSGASVQFGVAEDVLAAVSRVAATGGWVRVDLDVRGEGLLLGGTGESVSAESVRERLVPDAPSYFVLRGGSVEEVVEEGRRVDGHIPDADASRCLMLLFHCPDAAPVRAKMMAASARSVLEARVRALGLHLPVRVETRDADDVAERLAPPAAADAAAGDASPAGAATPSVVGDSAAGPGFAKPKGPGRRKK
jgi:twinfilin